MGEKGQRRITDFLALEAALALWFWFSYPVAIVPDRFWNMPPFVWNTPPLLGAVWFGLWVASPFVVLVGLLMIRRALRTPGGWVQVATGSVLAASIWYQFSRLPKPFFPD